LIIETISKEYFRLSNKLYVIICN